MVRFPHLKSLDQGNEQRKRETYGSLMRALRSIRGNSGFNHETFFQNLPTDEILRQRGEVIEWFFDSLDNGAFSNGLVSSSKEKLVLIQFFREHPDDVGKIKNILSGLVRLAPISSAEMRAKSQRYENIVRLDYRLGANLKGVLTRIKHVFPGKTEISWREAQVEFHLDNSDSLLLDQFEPGKEWTDDSILPFEGLIWTLYHHHKPRGYTDVEDAQLRDMVHMFASEYLDMISEGERV